MIWLMKCLILLRKSTERSERYSRWLKRAPQHTQDLWHAAGIEPRAIDREVSCALHMTHMGNTSKPEALIRQALQ